LIGILRVFLLSHTPSKRLHN